MTSRYACLALAFCLPPFAVAQQRTQAIGVSDAVAGYREVSAPVTSVASLTTDEATQTEITLRYAGWIEKVYVNTAFAAVEPGQALLTVYSPALYAAEQDYVFTVAHQAQLAGSAGPETTGAVTDAAHALLAAARARLRQEQVPEDEIARLERTGVARSRFTLRAPVGGIVTERMALPNQQVQPGMVLYRLAALNPIWADAAVNESDLGRVRVGQVASLTLDAYPGRTFAARVGFIYPQVDAASRTGRVRLVLPNGELRLFPGMFGSVRIEAGMGRQLVIPAGAVLQTGVQPQVFVDRGGGRLQPQAVELGPRVGDDYIVRGGLAAGTRVAADASFLIASEAQLSAAAGSFAPPPPGVGANAAAAAAPAAPRTHVELTTAPSPARKGSNVFRVRLTDAAGAPIGDAQVSLRLFMAAMPAMGMAQMHVRITMTARGGGLYEGSGNLGRGGRWQVSVTATRRGQTVAAWHSTLAATGGMGGMQ